MILLYPGIFCLVPARWIVDTNKFDAIASNIKLQS